MTLNQLIPKEKKKIISIVEKENKCKEIYEELKFNHETVMKYNDTVAGVLVLDIILIFGAFPVSQIFFKNFVINIIIGIAFLVLLFFTIKYLKLQDKYFLNKKEKLLFELCGVANHLSNFIKSDAYTKDIITAQNINRRLITSLIPYNSEALFLDRGFQFDKNLKELLILIRKLSDTKIQKILEGKRNDTQLKVIIESYREIAYLISQEEIISASKYITDTFQIASDEENTFYKILNVFSANNVFRWFLSFILISGLLIAVYFICKNINLISPEQVPLWTIFMFVFGFFTALYFIKTKIVDPSMDFLLKLLEKHNKKN